MIAVLFGGAAITYLLRVVFLGIVPAERLPRWVRDALPHIGPAALAALIVGALVHQGGLAALVVPTPAHLALLAAGLVAWRFRSLAAPMAAALLVMLAAGLLPT
ncbi:AzlD domain-containing protein [Pseudonocardia xishanensis]|uniref:Branched-subunit amino acid transport protein AzlD n=1 Tax=Pseudonocardia xishanensis TaxID=630995 RepID=A0ABP8S1V0_9PSEU